MPILQELKQSMDSPRRRPLLAAVAVSTLAIGICVNTVVFSAVNGQVAPSSALREE